MSSGYSGLARSVSVSVTIKEIAKRSGLSVPTVSRILNNDSDLFRPETKEKVLQAARELGYRPNSYRMALRTKRFNAIGLLLGQRQIEGSLAGGVIRSLLAELHGRNQHLLVGEVWPRGPEGAEVTEPAAPKMLREWSVDGTLIHCDEASPPAVEKLIRENRIPAIWFNCHRDADCVYPDEREGARNATERLIRVGHARILFAGLDGAADAAQEQRLGGYEAAVRDGGLTAYRVIPNDRVRPAERLDLLIEALRAPSGERPTAALCSGRMTATAMFAAALAGGLSVPRDLSIIAIHDDPVDDAGRRITTMCLPGSEMAMQGLAALNEKIADPTREMPSRAIPLAYCEGATLSPPGGV
jgi:LacI family transcriptional regulator